MAKKYYWLKLQRNFFDNPEIKILRRVAGGDTYTLIYLEMLLRSLENDGFLYFEHVGDDMADELSAVLGEKKEDVQFLLAFLKNKKLIEISNSNEFYLSNIKEMIGKETDSAKRMRILRAKEEPYNNGILDGKTSHCDTDVQISDTEKELERELELEKDVDVVQELRSQKEKNIYNENSNPLSNNQIDLKNVNTQSAISTWSNNVKFTKQYDVQKIIEWIADFEDLGANKEVAEEIVIAGMHQAIESDALKWTYLDKVLSSWIKEKANTLELVKQSHDKYIQANSFTNNNHGASVRKLANDRDEMDLGF